ncbi:MAG: two-component regulator propeller domain-containing protein [Bacteroidota bacterium]
MRKNILILFVSVILLPIVGIAQEVSLGNWRVHLPYKKCINVAQIGKHIYCATPYSLFYYNKEDNSVNMLNRVNGLSDVELSTIEYSASNKTLVIAYKNANIDLLREGSGITNISDIKRKQLYGNKTINNVIFIGDYAYFACGFGIVVLDLTRDEIRETWYIGPGGNAIDVLDLAFDGSKLYAATEKGIYVANFNSPNLANYANWTKDTTLNSPDASYNSIASFQGTVFANRVVPGYGLDTLFKNNGSGWTRADITRIDDVSNMRVSQNRLHVCYNTNAVIYFNPDSIMDIVWSYNPGDPQPSAALTDEEDKVWIADGNRGLMVHKGWDNEEIQLNGPGSTDVFSMDCKDGALYVAPGSIGSSWGNAYNVRGPYAFIGEKWFTLKDANPSLDTIFDILSVAIDPSNTNRMYAGSWGNGLCEFNGGILTQVYTYTNSPLQRPGAGTWLGVGGLCFDKDNNLWMSNSQSDKLLKVLKPNGTWDSYNVGVASSDARASTVMIDKNNFKWVLLTRYNGLVVFSDNNTLSDKSDDHSKVLHTGLGNGNLPSDNVTAIACDRDGEVWIGTDKGIAVFYSPENMFSGQNFDAQVITLVQDSTAQHLLEFETVTAITVDGSNKKWIGTEKAGVFLMSADGTEELQHFTVENSPLLSNTITSIVINEQTGEVYFGTAKGIISYRGFATAGSEKFEGVYAYPNPVREGYTGSIGIKGLVTDAIVKITDITGTLIYETKAEGGQAIWNGCNYDGKKAKSGVYLVFCSSEDAKEKMVTKILIIN